MIEGNLPAGTDIRIHSRLIAADEMQVYFNASDVVALPFRKILNSGSMLLAMSFGRCVVAPRAGSLPEAAYTEAYFAYDPDDPEGLAAELQRALSLPDLSARGLAAREYVREKNDWSEIGQRARRLYEDILGRPV
jgi:glycosyltransferase involved in cell wall biosynthesis